jgi:hypothetical protein
MPKRCSLRAGQYGPIDQPEEQRNLSYDIIYLRGEKEGKGAMASGLRTNARMLLERIELFTTSSTLSSVEGKKLALPGVARPRGRPAYRTYSEDHYHNHNKQQH